MNKIKQYADSVALWMRSPRNRHKVYLVIVVTIVSLFLYRFIMVAVEHNRAVYNATRDAIARGVPVNVVTVKKSDGEMREPITIKDNRAYVSGNRVRDFRAGMSVGDGEIVSVASGIDYDTGMYIVRTRGVADGLQYVTIKTAGYFVPRGAIHGDAVYVAREGIAKRVAVYVARQDDTNACVTDGLHDGDVVILTNVGDGDKIRVHE